MVENVRDRIWVEHVRDRIWVQHDGTPAHYRQAVRNFLNEQFNKRWIGRGGPMSWPPRSPDLMKFDFSRGDM